MQALKLVPGLVGQAVMRSGVQGAYLSKNAIGLWVGPSFGSGLSVPVERYGLKRARMGLSNGDTRESNTSFISLKILV